MKTTFPLNRGGLLDTTAGRARLLATPAQPLAVIVKRDPETERLAAIGRQAIRSAQAEANAVAHLARPDVDGRATFAAKISTRGHQVRVALTGSTVGIHDTTNPNRLP